MKKPLVIVISIAAAAAVLGISIGGYAFYKNANTKVEVFPVSYISTSSWGYNDSSYGIVTTDLTQDVYISETQVVQEVLVREGDMVDVGTPLVQLDNTLANLDLEMQALSIDNIDIQIEAVNREIYYLNTASAVQAESGEAMNVMLQPISRAWVASPNKGGADPDAIVYRLDNKTVLFLKEDTQNIYTVKCAPETIITSEFLYRIMGIDTDTGRAIGDPLVVFLQIPSMNRRIYLDGYTFQIPEDFYDMTLEEFMNLSDIPVSENSSAIYGEENPYDGIDPKERDTQLKAKKNELTVLNLDRREAVLKYEKMRKEVNAGTIVSTVKGQVKTVGSMSEGIDTAIPFITVTSQEGFYLEGTINELQLENVSVGQTVYVTNMETGMEAEAEITSISEFPVSDNANSYGTNPNTSNYPFTAYLSNTEGFKNNQSVSIAIQSGEGAGTGIYIPIAYIRDDGGESYVYIAGEDGKLKKQTVETGAMLYGYYQEIKSGLTGEEMITFPYGKNIKEGVKTIETDTPSVY